ncbi:MAG: short chain dehydrogenase [Deltaproteobacteria bacterium RIFCSPHIGHO2_02_FULL_38_15]|nr:MAG: short chain dehydrogenase [Deltaproteobacteria bacterium RIFCSPHIGHO2_02_FULL_38_15]
MGRRGIGKAIGIRAGEEGANVVIVSKTTSPHPKLSGTIYTAAQEIEKAGGKALPIATDIRFEEQVQAAVQETVQTFGGIDILVNNASAISLTDTLTTEAKKFDLMFSVNVRGTFLCSKACVPYLKKSQNPHILNLSPPLNLKPQWFSQHLAYTMSKYGMSECVLGMSEEFREDGIAVNALWPKTTIATAAIYNILGGEELANHSRTPQMVADAAYFIFTQNSRQCSGNFFIDEEVLKSFGVKDFKKYAINPNQELQPDFFI